MTLNALLDLCTDSQRLFILTGAGCSTGSGIPDYRDTDGRWKHRQPMTYQEFVKTPLARQRYWARSLVGWRRIADAEPGKPHQALARLEAAGRVRLLVTQNVDRLHAQAGSRRTVDLHGRLDRVECLECKTVYRREAFQDEMARLNPGWADAQATVAPDGDAHLARDDYESFQVPECPHCGGVLKPAVVFFGERVPKRRVEQAFKALDEADAVLVVGSSLMVFSGYRFARGAVERGLPLAVVNRGTTRADDELTLKVEDDCGDVLTALADRVETS